MNSISASISGASAEVRLPSGEAAGRSKLDRASCRQGSSVASAVIKVEIAADRCAGVTDAVIGPQIHLLVFDAAPQPLDEHVVAPCALRLNDMGLTMLFAR